MTHKTMNLWLQYLECILFTTTFLMSEVFVGNIAGFGFCFAFSSMIYILKLPRFLIIVHDYAYKFAHSIQRFEFKKCKLTTTNFLVYASKSGKAEKTVVICSQADLGSFLSSATF